MATAEAATGAVRVEKVRGRSVLTRCFARYPLKLIAPSKVGPASCDVVWLYALTYGGGIVSGDTISCTVSIGDGCTAAITTQASTKASVGEDALLAVIPDPVTCFSTARYHQKQVFQISANSNLVIVDWFTSGRYECGEKWDFCFFKSVNHIFLGDQPLFIDSVLLEQGSNCSIAEQMKEYNVIAMVVLVGPKLKSMQEQMQDEVRKLMSGQLRPPTSGGSLYAIRSQPLQRPQMPPLVASCSPFGRTGTGMVARVAAVSTELVYGFLRQHLAALEPFLGAPPYAAS
ncbi:unnamed protein product [Urochloa humidicola]